MFQRYINYVLREFLRIFVIAYLDNILIFSRSITEHIVYIRKVLQKLKDFNLQVKLEKCIFYVKEVYFLEYVILESEIYIDLEKVEVVHNWPMPTNKKEVYSFNSFLNYY